MPRWSRPSACSCFGASIAAAKPAKALGKTKRTPAPSCPKNWPNDSCEAVGSVTGFQMVADGDRAPFKAPRGRHLVAWAVDLSKPKKSEANFFGDFYESNQFGRRRPRGSRCSSRKDKRNYKLKSQSPVVGLNSVLGTRQTFTLTNPLKIRKGEFLALTIPTWAPSFAVGLSSDSNLWRASRDAGQCSATDPNRSRTASRSRRSARAGSTAATTRAPGSSTGPTTSRAEPAIGRHDADGLISPDRATVSTRRPVRGA